MNDETPTVETVRADLVAEQDALDSIITDLEPEAWALATPSPRWSIADQIGHLTYFDWTAALAISDPDRFTSITGELMSTMSPMLLTTQWISPPLATTERCLQRTCFTRGAPTEACCPRHRHRSANRIA